MRFFEEEADLLNRFTLIAVELDDEEVVEEE